MSVFKCDNCGALVSSDISHEMTVRCPTCACECREVECNESFVCKDCGLSCAEGIQNCPACGGEIVLRSKVNESSKRSEGKGDSYIENWESNLGGYSFQVVAGFVFSLFCSFFYVASVVRQGFFEMPCGSPIWYGLLFEIIVNPIMAVFALVLLILFFRRSKFLPTFISKYFKWYGILLLVDLGICICAVELMSEGASTTLDIKEFGSAMGCFFWSWYFKRLFKSKS